MYMHAQKRGNPIWSLPCRCQQLPNPSTRSQAFATSHVPCQIQILLNFKLPIMYDSHPEDMTFNSIN